MVVCLQSYAGILADRGGRPKKLVVSALGWAVQIQRVQNFWSALALDTGGKYSAKALRDIAHAKLRKELRLA